MRTIGYVRVSTDKQAERGISLDAQAEKIRAMALVQGAELSEIIVESGESAKSLNRPGMAKLLALVDAGKVKAVIVAKLDRLTRSVKDLCELLERFDRRGVALVSVAESLDTGSAAGRLVLNIMAAVSQWEREAIGERTRDALCHKRSRGERIGNIKGHKDRQVMLAEPLREVLAAYWRWKRPTEWLFPGRYPGCPIDRTSIFGACKKAARCAGITKSVHPHSLRHAFATPARRRGEPAGDPSPAGSRAPQDHCGVPSPL